MSQSINLAAIAYFPIAKWWNKQVAIPHVLVENIGNIDPEKLKFYGIKGLVFDKDNTLTAPYANEIYPTIQPAFAEYKAVFKDNILIDSNSAGTRDDKDYAHAEKIESDLGIRVLRHNWKKPAGIGAVVDALGYQPGELAMFGDRLFTDVVFGRRYGMLTIMSAMLTEEGDNKAAAKIRRLEIPYLKKLMDSGLQATPHPLYNEEMVREHLDIGTLVN